MLTPHLHKSVLALFTRPIASHLQAHSTSAIHQHHNDVETAAEQWRLHSLERHDRLAISVTMSATDEELQKLGKPSIYSGKEEDVWNEWSVAMRSYVSLLSTRSSVADRCRRTCEGRHEYDANHNHAHGRVCNGSQETLPRLGDEREGFGVGSGRGNHRHERSTGMASVDHEIRTEHSATFAKPHERNRPGKGVSLRTHSFRNRTETIRKWESISGDRFDASMKKAFFLHRESRSRCRIWTPSKRCQQ